eukprot:5141042-Amphidinium_carterae.1
MTAYAKVGLLAGKKGKSGIARQAKRVNHAKLIEPPLRMIVSDLFVAPELGADTRSVCQERRQSSNFGKDLSQVLAFKQLCIYLLEIPKQQFLVADVSYLLSLSKGSLMLAWP